jgi:predicted SAM-dependent methyltransferase
MMRKLARALVGRESVRDELNTAQRAISRAFRTLRQEWLHKSEHLRRCSGVKVNVACGNLVREGWINVDLYPGPGAFYMDVVQGLPFADGAVEHIHCEHFLEHLSFEQAGRFLAECHRVLAPGGGMRIVVPDAEKYIAAYSRNDAGFFEQLRFLGKAARPLDTPIQVINQMFRMGGDHKFAWDFATLSRSASAAGFAEIKLSFFGDVAPELAIDGTDEWRMIESLYANLRKR